jgi:hypothetical protein
MAAPASSQEADWAREKRELEERIKQLEALQQQQRPQPAPAAPQPTAAAPETARLPSAEENQAMVKRLSALIPESSNGGNVALLRHVSAVTANLLRPPYREPKFRRLRCANPTLAAELFSHPSALPVLCEVLEFEQRPQEDGECYLEVPPSTAGHITTLRSVAAALPELTKRDDIAAEAAKRFDAFRRSVAFETRMEKLSAVAGSRNVTNTTSAVSDDVRGFVVAALLWNETDAGIKTVSLLRTIGRNISADPSNPKLRSLRVMSSVVRDSLLPSSGSVEFLLAVLGFGWGPDGLLLRFADEDGGSHSDDGCMNTAAAYELRWQVGQQLLNEAEHGLSEKRAAERELRRQAALEERQAEKRRILDEQNAARRRAAAGSSGAAAPDDDGDSPKVVGERIPIAEALRRILGKDRD